MKKVSFTGLLLAALTFSACHQCQNFTRVEQAPIIKKYFGNYKPGAYWIYLNRDSTKRDSVWISDYTSSPHRDRLEQCMEMEENIFKVNAVHLSRGVSSRGSIGPNGSSFDYTIASICGYGFMARQKDNSFRIGSSYSPGAIIKNYPLWPGNSNEIIAEGIQVNDVFLAPDIGIVQFVAYYGPDTFSLVKFHKP